MHGVSVLRLLLSVLALLAALCVSGHAQDEAQNDRRADDPVETGAAATDAPPQGPIRVLELDGALGPAISDYIVAELEQAAADDARLVILRIDTPGGLDGAMRDIVQAVLASPVPVVGHVAPEGARAASAGTYILYATHIAAMAPATNLGAATPVSIGGGGPSPGSGGGRDSQEEQAEETSDGTPDSAEASRRKAVNDAVAYIRSLAERRDRNADWAERAVREGVSLTAQQALDQNVIEHIAASRTALLAAIDGRVATTAAGERVLDVADAPIETRAPDWKTELLAIVTNPTVAYLLFMIGIYGLILEALNPGTGVPGVIGGISLITALFAFQILPVDYAGMALILLGGALIVAELFVPSFGILGIGGVVAFVFGSIMLMDTDVPGYDMPVGAIAALAVASALALVGIVYLFHRSRRERVQTGHTGLIGAPAVALDDFVNGVGRVQVQGESWQAASDQAITRDQALIVTDKDGLRVTVRPAGTDEPRHPTPPRTAAPRPQP